MKPSLAAAFEALRQSDSPQRRGYQLQDLVGDVLKTEHFRVERRSRVAAPRQVDLFATRGPESFLIETKWRKKPADVADVDALYTRLDAAPSSVVGVLVSVEGFTPQALTRVKARANEPVLLVTGDELEGMLQLGGSFATLLRQKKDALVTHREVRFGLGASRSPRRLDDDAVLPSSQVRFLWADGREEMWLTSGGGFGRFVFARELQDIDWAFGGGTGVALDLQLRIDGQAGVISVLQTLADMGWTGREGRWSIQQATANWHGFGAASLAVALRGWRERYGMLSTTHHTEEVTYLGFGDFGFYTVSAALSADQTRHGWTATASFRLSGIPLDASHLQELCKAFGVEGEVVFRPLVEPTIRRDWLDGRPELTPVAVVVQSDNETCPSHEEEWVVGVVVENVVGDPSADLEMRNPSAGAVDVYDFLKDSEYLICELRSWHLLGKPRPTYRLWGFESAWTSDALILRVIADWDDDSAKDDGLEAGGNPILVLDLDSDVEGGIAR
jgi:hypothetical protein